MSKTPKVLLFGFMFGALVPLFWGVLSFLLFNLREGWFSRAYRHAVYITCPSWVIEGEKALFLMPILNGTLYGILAVVLAKMFGALARSK